MRRSTQSFLANSYIWIVFGLFPMMAFASDKIETLYKGKILLYLGATILIVIDFVLNKEKWNNHREYNAVDKLCNIGIIVYATVGIVTNLLSSNISEVRIIEIFCAVICWYFMFNRGGELRQCFFVLLLSSIPVLGLIYIGRIYAPVQFLVEGLSADRRSLEAYLILVIIVSLYSLLEKGFEYFVEIVYIVLFLALCNLMLMEKFLVLSIVMFIFTLSIFMYSMCEKNITVYVNVFLICLVAVNMIYWQNKYQMFSQSGTYIIDQQSDFYLDLFIMLMLAVVIALSVALKKQSNKCRVIVRILMIITLLLETAAIYAYRDQMESDAFLTDIQYYHGNIGSIVYICLMVLGVMIFLFLKRKDKNVLYKEVLLVFLLLVLIKNIQNIMVEPIVTATIFSLVKNMIVKRN